jgi:hypothetical protein
MQWSAPARPIVGLAVTVGRKDGMTGEPLSEQERRHIVETVELVIDTSDDGFDAEEVRRAVAEESHGPRAYRPKDDDAAVD